MTPPATRLDVRLVPAALAAWAVTAAGLVWGLGLWLAALSVGIGASWRIIARRWRSLMRPAAAGVVATAIVGAGFGVSIALRTDAVHSHPLSHRFGAAVWVTVAPMESPRRAGPARVMFRADLTRLGDADSGGAVAVFGPAADFGHLGVGQPARFRARIARPGRRDLTVAVLTAIGRPVSAGPLVCSVPPGRFGTGSPPPPGRYCPPIRPRCCRDWYSVTPLRSRRPPPRSSVRPD